MKDISAACRRKPHPLTSHGDLAAAIGERVQCLDELSDEARAKAYWPSAFELWSGCGLYGGSILQDSMQLRRMIAAQDRTNADGVREALDDFLLQPSEELARAFYRRAKFLNDMESAVRGALYAAMLGDKYSCHLVNTNMWAQCDTFLHKCLARGLQRTSSQTVPEHTPDGFQTNTIRVGFAAIFDDHAMALAVSDGLAWAEEAAEAAERKGEQDAVLEEMSDAEAEIELGDPIANDDLDSEPEDTLEFREEIEEVMHARLAQIAASPRPATLMVLQGFEKMPATGNADRQALVKQYGALAGQHTPLVIAEDIAEVRHDLLSEWPHAVDLIDILLRDVMPGAPLRIRPTLLVGPPGSGKTTLLRDIASAFECPVTVYPCASVSDGSFGGTPAQWSTRRASTPLELIRQSKIANPIIILDELEKSGQGGHSGDLVSAILPMLERHTSGSYFEVGLEMPANLSAVTFLATANSLSIPAPLIDRFRVIEMPEARAEHAGVLSRRIFEAIARDRGYDTQAWIPPLNPDEIDVIERGWGGGSLRRLRFAIEATLSVRDRVRGYH